MALTDYTSALEVRAALGVDETELTDASLALPMYETELGISLSLVSANLQADYLVINAKTAKTRSTAEELVLQRTRLFSTYTIATVALTSLPLGTFKGESDEKADYTRFSGNVQDQVAARIATRLERATTALASAYGALIQVTAIVTDRIFAAPSSPSYDPVTG